MDEKTVERLRRLIDACGPLELSTLPVTEMGEPTEFAEIAGLGAKVWFSGAWRKRKEAVELTVEAVNALPTLLDYIATQDIEIEQLRQRLGALQKELYWLPLFAGILDREHKPDGEVVSIGTWIKDGLFGLPEFNARMQVNAEDFRKARAMLTLAPDSPEIHP